MYKKGSTRRTRRFPRIRGTFCVQSGRVKRFSVLASGLGTILTATRYCSVWILFFLFFPSLLPSFFLSSFWQIDFGFFLDGSRDRGRRSVDDLGSVQSCRGGKLEILKEFIRRVFRWWDIMWRICDIMIWGEDNARGWIPESFIRLGFENS